MRAPRSALRTVPSSLAALLCLFAACSTQTAIDASNEYARLGDFRHAYEVLDTAREQQLADGDVDPRLAEAHERMRRLYLRDRARRLIFQEREDEALADLDTLAEVDPDFPELASLRERALRKKAKRIVFAADELLAEQDFAGAMKGYLESQRLVPGFELAADGMTKVQEELARLNARAQQQFLEAVRKVPEFRFVEVQWHAANVIHNTPDREDATALRERARRENARDTFARAEECQQQNQFGAALVLYRSARELDPELEGVEQAIERMQQELDVLATIERAEIAMRNDEFDVARQLLSDAYGQSKLSRGAISELMIENRELEGRHRYRAARDLEVLGEKAEALAAFEALAADWPDGLEDEQARIQGLRVDIEGAAAEWAAAEAAEAAGELEQALDHYINAERYYPKWRDGETHIERLRKEIAGRGGSGGGDPGSSERGSGERGSSERGSSGG